MIDHCFPPIYNSESKILILGSFPSVKSREDQFYYAHPSNRFWKLLSRILEVEEVKTIEEKTELLIKNKIALYDAVERARIEGSMDADLEAIEEADLEPILKATKIRQFFCNGTKSYDIVKKSYKPIKLPSTSAANARYRMDDLYDSWKIILDYL